MRRPNGHRPSWPQSAALQRLLHPLLRLLPPQRRDQLEAAPIAEMRIAAPPAQLVPLLLVDDVSLKAGETNAITVVLRIIRKRIARSSTP